MAHRLSIDVYYELICPWCWIGKRQLDRALDLLPPTELNGTVQLRWHAVQLLPDLPESGLPFAEFYRHRLGSLEAVQLRQAQVNVVAERAGLFIDFSRIPMMPNTAKAHRLLAFALENGTPQQHEQLLERLFAGHFLQMMDIGDTATLLTIAHACGLDVERVANRMLGDTTSVGGDVPPNTGGGVPCFVFNNRLMVSGAHPPEVLLQAMRQSMTHAAP